MGLSHHLIRSLSAVRSIPRVGSAASVHYGIHQIRTKAFTIGRRPNFTSITVLSCNCFNLRRPASTTASPYASPPPSSSSFALPKLDFPALDAKWLPYLTDLTKPLPTPFANPTTPLKDPQEKFYILAMFPYPSGTLHMGHLRVYTISDALARFRRLQGYTVLHPMGWDSFGLPAENAAMANNVDPKTWTEENIVKMKTQLREMGAGFDWDREIATHLPEYYAHTQRLFLRLWEKGLAYRAGGVVNWDPVDQTVVANEQVDREGRSWRSGALVERKVLEQWFLGIREEAEGLLEGLQGGGEGGLGEGWQGRVRSMQENWIGKSVGSKIKFTLRGEGTEVLDDVGRKVEVFTTRADTLAGVQYLALSVSHPLVKKLAEKDTLGLKEYIAKTEAENAAAAVNAPAATLPKTGFRLPGIWAENPLFPENFNIPVFTAAYVLEGYGSGAVMGVPGHDTRDNAFFRENFPPGAEVLKVVIPDPNYPSEASLTSNVFTDNGILSPTTNPPTLAGLTTQEAIQKLTDTLHLATPHTHYRLRDWLISRQRYWGAPIPIIYCPTCGPVPVPDSDLPVLLPPLPPGMLKTSGSPLKKLWDDMPVECPKCGNEDARRETDTMDTFVDSSWYFLRFPDAHNTKEMFNKQVVDNWMPVDIYVGGIEHAILHLLYARFISRFLASSGHWSGGSSGHNNTWGKGEPFKRLITQGMVHGRTLSEPVTGRFLPLTEVSIHPETNEEIITSTGQKPIITFEKMSKSKYNGVDPGECIRKWGLDATRVQMLFAAPVGDVVEWDEGKCVGVQRWLGRVWRIVGEVRMRVGESELASSSTDSRGAGGGNGSAIYDVEIALNKTIQAVTHSLESTISLNTIISDLMSFTNILHSAVFPPSSPSPSSATSPPLSILLHTTHTLLTLMHPFAPAFTLEALFHLHTSPLTSTSPIHLVWPQPNHSILTHSAQAAGQKKNVVVQVNGKMRYVVEGVGEDVWSDEGRLVEFIKRDGGVGGGDVGDGGKLGRWISGEGRKVKEVLVKGGGRVVNFIVEEGTGGR